MGTGYDTPADASGDALQRRPFARQVYQLLVELPNDWSVRIGVHGEWGAGKTTILNYIRDMANKDGHVVANLAPWTVKTQEDLWQLFLIELTKALSEHGISIKASILAKLGTAWVQNKGIGELAQSLSELHPVARVFTNTFFILLQRLLDVNGESFKGIRDQLKARRMIVIIDDLDHADPSILPQLFLSLRDLLDVPGFSFILAFDDDVVAGAIRSERAAYESGKDFLEKLLDFTFSLPKISEDRKIRFLRETLEASPHASNVLQLTELPTKHILPNPRKIKRFVRHLTTAVSSVERCDPDEISIAAIQLGELIRLESEEFFDGIITRVQNVETDWDLVLARDDKDKEGELRERMKGWLPKRIAPDSEVGRRLVDLAEEWRRLCTFKSLDVVIKSVTLLKQPPAVTMKEARNVLQIWAGDGRSLGVIDDWLLHHAEEFGKEVEQVASALFLSLQEVRGRGLQWAAGARTADKNRDFVQMSLAALDLQVDLYLSGLEAVGSEFFRTAAALEMLISKSVEWAHFRVNPSDKQARDHEKQAIARCTEMDIPNPEELLMRYRPWGAEILVEHTSAAFRDLAGPAMQKAEHNVAGRIIERFSMDGGIMELLSSQESAERHVISQVSGPLWSEPLLSTLLGVLKESENNPIVHENAYYFFEMLCFSRDGGYWPLRESTIKELITRRSRVLKLVWDASVARVIQFRMQHDLAKCREQLIDSGLPETDLRLPSWWVTDEQYKALTGRSLS